MQRPIPNKRAATRLSRSLEKKLIAYAAAATAAGLGITLFAAPAEGKVVSTINWLQILPVGKVNLDLNNDGIPDFQFSNRFSGTYYHVRRHGTLQIVPQDQSNAIWGTAGTASALASGVTIGSGGKFQPGHQFMANASYRISRSAYYGNYGSGGPWKQTSRNYLGFKFIINGEIHYGWARVNAVATNGGMYAAVSQYAYETIPNKSIRTGQTGGIDSNQQKQRTRPKAMTPPPAGSLGNLAAGAPARQKP